MKSLPSAKFCNQSQQNENGKLIQTRDAIQNRESTYQNDTLSFTYQQSGANIWKFNKGGKIASNGSKSVRAQSIGRSKQSNLSQGGASLRRSLNNFLPQCNIDGINSTLDQTPKTFKEQEVIIVDQKSALKRVNVVQDFQQNYFSNNFKTQSNNFTTHVQLIKNMRSLNTSQAQRRKQVEFYQSQASNFFNRDCEDKNQSPSKSEAYQTQQPRGSSAQVGTRLHFLVKRNNPTMKNKENPHNQNLLAETKTSNQNDQLSQSKVSQDDKSTISLSNAINRQSYQQNFISQGSKVINDEKVQKTNQLHEEIKRKCFQDYGSTEKAGRTMIDMYIENSKKQNILTPGFQKFENQLMSQMVKIKERQSQDISKDKQKRSLGGYYQARENLDKRSNDIDETYENAKTSTCYLNKDIQSKLEKQKQKYQEGSFQSNELKQSKSNYQSRGARTSHSLIYYSGGMPKNLINKKGQFEEQSRSRLQNIQQQNKTEAYFTITKQLQAQNTSASTNLKANQNLNKDKMNYARSKWMQKHGIQILVMQSKETEDESRKLFRQIDFANDGFVTRQQLQMFIKYMEEEVIKDSGVSENNSIFKKIKQISKDPQLKQIDEETFALQIAKLSEYKSSNFYSKNKQASNRLDLIQNNNDKADSQSGPSSQVMPLSKLLDLDGEQIERRVKLEILSNLSEDARKTIEQAAVNFETAMSLKAKLSNIQQKCLELKTITLSSQNASQMPSQTASIVFVGESNLIEAQQKQSSLNIQSKNINQNQTYIQLRKSELKDLQILFKKLSVQLERIEQHLGKSQKLTDFEMLEFKLKQFGVHISQVQQHIQDTENKILRESNIKNNPLREKHNRDRNEGNHYSNCQYISSEDLKDDFSLKQLKALNQAINRKAVMSQIAEDFYSVEAQQNQGGKKLRKKKKKLDQLADAKINYMKKIKNSSNKKQISNGNQRIEDMSEENQGNLKLEGEQVQKSDHTKTITIMSSGRGGLQYDRKVIASDLDSEEDSDNQFSSNSEPESEIYDSNPRKQVSRDILQNQIMSQQQITMRNKNRELTKRFFQVSGLEVSSQNLINSRFDEKILRIQEEDLFQQENNVVNQGQLFIIRELKPQVNREQVIEQQRQTLLKLKEEEDLRNSRNQVNRVSTNYVLNTHESDDLKSVSDNRAPLNKSRRGGKIELEQNFDQRSIGEIWIFRPSQEVKEITSSVDASKKVINFQTFEVKQFKNQEFSKVGVKQITLFNDELLIYLSKIFCLNYIIDCNKLLYTRNTSQSVLNEIKELENYSVNAAAINESQLFISYNDGKALVIKDKIEKLPQLSMMKKCFTELHGSQNFFIGKLKDEELIQIGYMTHNQKLEKIPPQKQGLFYEKINFPIPNLKIKQLSLGECHAIALAYNGKAFTWGSNGSGQLGLPLATQYSQDDFVKHPTCLNYYNKITQVCAFGNSTGILDDLNNLMTCGDNTKGQLGHNEEYDYSEMLQRANKDLIIEEIVLIRGQDFTFSFLTKAQQIYVCGNFSIPLDGKAEFRKGKGYAQNLKKPERIRFLFEKKIRYKINNYQINSQNLVLLTDIDPYCTKINLQ